MSRLIIDTYSHSSIMESARPTGQKASAEYASKLKDSINNFKSMDDIKTAFKTFFAARGLNIISWMLDNFFTGGERAHARNYLIAMECISILAGVEDNAKAKFAKQYLYDYLKEINVLAADNDVLENELKYDIDKASGGQSPYLMGRLLSKFCSLSTQSTDMVKTWQVGAFNVYGGLKQQSCINTSSGKKEITDLPVCGSVILNDDGLSFKKYPFEFRSSSIARNRFCKEFLYAKKVGDTRESCSDMLSDIHRAKEDVSEEIKKYEEVDGEISAALKNINDTEADINQRLRDGKGNTGDFEKNIETLITSAEKMAEKSLCLNEIYNAVKKKIEIFEEFKAEINNEVVDGKLVETVSPENSGENRVIKLVYSDDKSGIDPEKFSHPYWQNKETTRPHQKLTVNCYDLPQQYMDAQEGWKEKFQTAHCEAYINLMKEYEGKVDDYGDQCVRFANKNTVLEERQKEMRDLLKTKALASQSTGPIDAIAHWLNQAIAVQQVADSIAQLQNEVSSMGPELYAQRNILNEEIKTLQNSDNKMPGDDLDNIMLRLGKHIANKPNIRLALKNILNERIISAIDLTAYAKLEPSERIQKTQELARQHYVKKNEEKNYSLRDAMNIDMSMFSSPKASPQSSPKASPKSSPQPILSATSQPASPPDSPQSTSSGFRRVVKK